MAITAPAGVDGSLTCELSPSEFAQFQQFIYDAAGITLAEGKQVLVISRLGRRLQHCGCATYGEYLQLLRSGTQPQETQNAIDLLTTNETYFFREPRHFDFLREQARQAPRNVPLRVWSAAGSTGEEAYSIAMVLEDCLTGVPWEVIATDISARCLTKARYGHYPMERGRNIPLSYLQRFCLKGAGRYDNTLLIERRLREKVKFLQANLNAPLPNLGLFDFVFLRNVLIYFNPHTKRAVLARVLAQLKPGGWLFIGHSENIRDLTESVVAISPSVFQKA